MPSLTLQEIKMRLEILTNNMRDGVCEVPLQTIELLADLLKRTAYVRDLAKVEEEFLEAANTYILFHKNVN